MRILAARGDAAGAKERLALLGPKDDPSAIFADVTRRSLEETLANATR